MLDKLPTRWQHRVEDIANAVTSWVRQPTRRIKGLKEIETGLALLARDITNPPRLGQLVPPIKASVTKNKLQTTVLIQHSNTYLQAEEGKFSVTKTHGPLKNSLTFEKHPSEKTNSTFASTCGGKPFSTELRWYHFQAKRHTKQIRNHITTIVDNMKQLPISEEDSSTSSQAIVDGQTSRENAYPKIVAVRVRH